MKYDPVGVEKLVEKLEDRIDAKDARIKELEEALYRVVQATRDGPLLPDGVIQQCRDVSNRPDRKVP